MKGKIKDYQRKFLSSADAQEVLNYNGFKIQTYHWVGSGPMILLMHGWESNTWRWRYLIKHLRESGYNVVALDAPAHGASGSKRFNAVLYAQFAHIVCQKYQPNFIVGHSVGGMAAIYLASHFPLYSVKAYIVIASSNRWLEVVNKFHHVLGLNHRIIDNFESAFRKYFDHPQSYYNADEFAKRISQPGLVLHDVDDNINFITEGRAIAANWNNSELVETKGLGHSMQAKEVYEAISNFIIKH
jgi:pimeloyl-ACP methyl ester carboxylesterase